MSASVFAGFFRQAAKPPRVPAATGMVENALCTACAVRSAPAHCADYTPFRNAALIDDFVDGRVYVCIPTDVDAP
jgi:hypothetical protein